jgi:hypothetical protein
MQLLAALLPDVPVKPYVALPSYSRLVLPAALADGIPVVLWPSCWVLKKKSVACGCSWIKPIGGGSFNLTSEWTICKA